MPLLVSFLVALFTAARLSGQTTSVIVVAGYESPIPLVVAPGQVITLFAYGLHAQIPRAAATGLPLPRVLAGISVRLVVNGGHRSSSL